MAGRCDPLNAAPHWALRCRPLHADEPCGDAGGLWPLDVAEGEAPAQLLALIDGLGHGAPAAEAAQAALRWIGVHAGLPLPEMMAGLDEALRDTRGAAVGLARLQGARMAYAGVGNTRALRWRGAQWLRLSSQYGIVGGGLAQPVTVTAIDLQPGDWLLLFSDGLDEMLKLPAQLPEWQRDPGLLCEHLIEHKRLGRDDVGVLALRLGPA